ncbi:tRNA (adenosine(37)-N6)-dimethylallyltransferase MiaA [Alkalicoccus saliphilus]|uniref:tRNA dimethylallyltransferase n=1 Tax=Alkalicoccus saliphilus TaxID=200989 RepID=A0A2T4U882_9BACI|nr:tRNA (adenosine(37)-N6)-dimethylallyltransferase MiaA [Alkalicoccus saliphilus]PTL39590.1 tRNA (adenosine(37)-N6)-dimethylallyltransferase MiaA [Alkalicoccus saliphilus]
MKQPLIVIVGPTAVGKTTAGITLAQKFEGEIISGDSMQVYKGMNIGTAKVTENEKKEILHHLIDIRSPGEEFSAADFKKEAETAIEAIASKHKIPIIVGGTGMYIQSLLYGYSFGHSDEDPEYRKELEHTAQLRGGDYLHQILTQKDRRTAEAVHPNNVRRVIRALEIIHRTNAPVPTEEERKKQSPYNIIPVGLTMDRKVLYERINKRVDDMINSGLLEEVARLVEMGYENSRAMRAIGYKELIPVVKKEQSLQEAAEMLKMNSRRFAKRQLTWFRNKMPVEWFDMTVDREEKLHEIEDFVAGVLTTAEK